MLCESTTHYYYKHFAACHDKFSRNNPTKEKFLPILAHDFQPINLKF